jgi:RNA polymerase sigma factor for flagellar operon FliA
VDGAARVGEHRPGTNGAAHARRDRSDEAAAEAVVRRHLALVREVAYTIADRRRARADFDELVSWGLEGLLDAHRRFRPDKHASFRTYARFRVRGAILDNLRDRDWLSRTARRRAVALERTRDHLEATRGRAPTEEELAAALQLDLATVRTIAAQAELATISVEDLAAAPRAVSDVEPHLPDRSSDPLRALLERERARLLTVAVRQLPEKEHAAVALYYRQDLTMRQVADALGLSESRVSQLHSQALGRLRALLDPALTVAE